MSEFTGADELRLYLANVRQAENEVQEILRDKFLQSNFFHDGIYELEFSEYFELHERFIQEKKGKNFGERFAMAVSDEYVGKVKLVELGATNHDASSSEEIKDDYKDLREWLVNHGVIKGEMTREESKRLFAVRESSVQPPSPGIDKRLIVSRIRPLIVASMINEQGTPVKFELFKQMVFSMPQKFYTVLSDRYGADGDEWPEAMKQHVENLLHEFNNQDQPLIQKINTGYYLASNKASGNIY